MTPRPYPESNRLAAALDRCLALAAAWEDEVCRTSRLKYATVKKLTDGAGAKRWGGRWNPPGVAAVYCSLDAETALAEMRQRHRHGGVPLRKMMPRLFVAMRVRLRQVLDLTQRKARRILAVSVDRLCEEWQDGDVEPITQAIGRLAWERAFDGLLVPSVPARAQHGINLVVFPDRAPADWGAILNKDELAEGE